MSLNILHRRRNLSQVIPADFIYDTSTFYSNNKRMQVKRESDLVTAYFTPLEVVNGTYSTWLGGSNGILIQFKDANLENPLTNTNNPYLLTDGNIAFTNDNTTGTLPGELGNSFLASMVMTDSTAYVNQTTHFAFYGGTSGVSFAIRYVEASSFKKRECYFSWKLESGVIIRRVFTASNYNNAIDNVFVIEVINDVARVFVNNLEYAHTSTTDVNAAYYNGEASPNKILLGNRTNPSQISFKAKHFSILSNPLSKNVVSQSQELMNIYQS